MTDHGSRAPNRFRVMHVTHDMGVGGLPRVVETLASTADRSQFDVQVLCLREKGPLAERLEANGVEVVLIDRPRHRPDYFPFARIAAALRRFGANVVHTHNTEPLIGAGVASLFTGVRTLIHTDHSRQFPDKFRYMLAEHVLSYRAYRVVGVSEHTTRNLRRYERIPERKLLTIPNGIDVSRFNGDLSAASARQRLGVTGRGPVIGVSCRLEHDKGVQELLRAVAPLTGRYPDLTVLVAGDGSYRGALEALVSELGLSSHVRFLGVVLDIPTFLRTLDIYVLPSLWEGLPMAILEAMASGLAVVATRVGGIPSAVTDGENGMLVPPATAAAIGAALASLADDPALRERLGRAARQAVHDRFSARAMTRRYEALYRRDETY